MAGSFPGGWPYHGRSVPQACRNNGSLRSSAGCGELACGSALAGFSSLSEPASAGSLAPGTLPAVPAVGTRAKLQGFRALKGPGAVPMRCTVAVLLALAASAAAGKPGSDMPKVNIDMAEISTSGICEARSARASVDKPPTTGPARSVRGSTIHVRSITPSPPQLPAPSWRCRCTSPTARPSTALRSLVSRQGRGHGARNHADYTTPG